jgi:hypothetical protein
MAEEKSNKQMGAKETPEQKFKRLATARVNNALSLKFAVEEVEEKFKKGKKKDTGFQL